MKRILCIFMCFMTLLCAVGCDRGQGQGTETEPETTAPVPTELSIIRDGTSEFCIVRSEDAKKEIIDLCVELAARIKAAYGVTIPVMSDFGRQVKKSTGPAIYVGITEEAGCAEYAAGLLSKDYLCAGDGTNLYLIGGTDEATVDAVDYFLNKYVEKPQGSDLIWSGPDYVHKKNYAYASLTVNGRPISDYRIVYAHGSDFYKEDAEALQAQLCALCGIELKLASDVSAPSDYEILVGSTTREESKRAAAALGDGLTNYNKWSLSLDGTRLVLASHGIRSAEFAVTALTDALKNHAGKQTGLSSDLCDFLGTDDLTKNVHADRDAAADLRIMDANIMLTNEASTATDKRGELFCDIAKTFAPDVICFNEFYYDIAASVTRGLSDEYVFLTPDFEDIFHGDYTGYTNDLAKLQAHVCAEIFAYRKDAGLTVKASGFRYTTEKWWVHAIAWVLFERADGRTFIAMGNHYGAQEVGNFGTETVACINELRGKYPGVPILVTGDLYAWAGDPPYNTILAAGFEDTYADRTKRVVNLRGSAHSLGTTMTGTDSPIDHILVSKGVVTLKHHLIADKYSMWSSDHFPLYADVTLPR